MKKMSRDFGAEIDDLRARLRASEEIQGAQTRILISMIREESCYGSYIACNDTVIEELLKTQWGREALLSFRRFRSCNQTLFALADLVAEDPNAVADFCVRAPQTNWESSFGERHANCSWVNVYLSSSFTDSSVKENPLSFIALVRHWIFVMPFRHRPGILPRLMIPRKQNVSFARFCANYIQA